MREIDVDQNLERPPHRHRIEERRVPDDDTPVFKPLDAPQARAGGQADSLGQLDVRESAVVTARMAEFGRVEESPG